MIFGNHVAKVKLVEQLTLVTLQTAHHGSTSPRFASTQRNHGSPHPSMTFATKSALFGSGRLMRDVRCSGKTGSRRPRVKPARLTQSGIDLFEVSLLAALRCDSLNWTNKDRDATTHVHHVRLRCRNGDVAVRGNN